MRTRSIVLIVAILLVAGFAALNWSEIVRPSPLLFGPVIMDAPLGAILLSLLAITLILFLASTAAMRTQSLMDYRHNQKSLEAQRELADKAEASRFHELRSHIDEHLRAVGERDALAAAEFDKNMLQSRQDMQATLEQINRTLSARLNELEHRLETRFERMAQGLPPAAIRAPVQTTPVKPGVLGEHPSAQPVGEQDAAAAAERPTEAGWRRWF